MENPEDVQQFVHVSLRIPSEFKRQLEDEARENNTNFNSLMNKIVLKHLTYARLVERAGGIMLGRQLFEKMLGKISIDDMSDIGKELNRNAVRNTFNFFNIATTLDNLVRHYLQPMSNFSGRYKFHLYRNDTEYKMILEHKYGVKWSAFLKEHFRLTFKSIVGAEPDLEIDGRSLIARYRSADNSQPMA